MKRKEKLIESLEKVVVALKNDSIHYNWRQASSCNCGVVAQSLLNLSSQSFRKLTNTLFIEKDFDNFFGSQEKSVSAGGYTWKNAAKIYCPITGIPIHEVFKTLHIAGLTKDDIVHLEYMENPTILKRAKIRKSFFGKEHYTKKENLIKYLSAWIEILKENVVQSEKPTVDELRAAELNAVAEENYELAAKIRNQITA